MEEIKLIGHNTMSSLDSIKMATLYFDKIQFINYYRAFYLTKESERANKPLIMLKAEFSEEDFKSHIKPLVEGNILKPMNLPYKDIIGPIQSTKFKGRLINTYELTNEEINNTIIGHPEVLHKKEGYTEIWSRKDENRNNNDLRFTGFELEELVRLRKELNFNSNGFKDVYRYFGLLLESTLDLLNKGDSFLTTSEILNDFLKIHFSGNTYHEIVRKFKLKLQINPQIVFDAISLNVPNITKLSIEDALELKLKLNDELLAFKFYMNNLQFELENNFNDTFIRVKSKEIVNSKIAPALEDLNSKLGGIKTNIPAYLIKEVKDPKSYAPLILSMTNNISNTAAILVSLGIMSLSSAMEYFTAKKAIKKNGLYYLLRLKEKT